MTSLGTHQTITLRGLLIEHVTHPVPRWNRPRPIIAGIIAVPVAATLIAAAVLLGPGTARAQAADHLRHAADRTITAADPVVKPGQYLKITTQAAYLAYEQDAAGHRTAYRSPSVTEVFIPADRRGTWVERVTAKPASEFFGTASHAAAERDWATTLANGVVRITRAPAGQFAPTTELGGPVPDPVLPGNPDEALAFLHRPPYGDGTDVGALQYAGQLLRTGTMTAAERSTLYHALALLPGIRIADDKAVLDGRTGTAFSLGPKAKAVEIIIDPHTGLFIGERSLTPSADGPIPARTPMDSTAVTTVVVDSAP